MRKVISLLFMILCSCALMLAGCAKEKVVKPDEAATAPSAEQKAAKQPEQAVQPVKEEKIASPAIKESPVARDEASSAASAANEQAARLLNAVFFDFDSSVLSQTARDTLANNASVLLKKQTGLKVQIEGHCDERGSAEYNLALGERRAKSAMNYLITLGVPANRLSTISYGKEKPADPGHDEAAWAKNRRAEFVAAK